MGKLLKNIKAKRLERKAERKAKKETQQALKKAKKEAKIEKIQAKANVKNAKAESIANGTYQSPLQSLVGGATNLVGSLIGVDTTTPETIETSETTETPKNKNLVAWIGGGVVGLFLLILGIVNLIKK